MNSQFVSPFSIRAGEEVTTMDLLAVIMNIVNRVPIERLLFRPPDHTKAIEDFARSLPPTESPKEAPPEQKTTVTTKTPEKVAQAVSTSVLERPGLSTEETVAYQNREIGKQLLAMESHYAQRMRIAGTPCDCGATKHLLYMEQLCLETIPMVSAPSTYEEIISWIREAEPKSTEAAVRSGKYDQDYPVLSGQAREFRKRVMGTLSPAAMIESKAPITLEEAKKLAAEEAAREIEKRWKEKK